METIHIDMSYIVAAVLVTKNKYYKESYCTIEECNNVKYKLRNNLDNIIFNNNIDNHYFKICREVIVLKEDIDLIDIENRFQAYLPYSVLSIIWNTEYLYKILESSKADRKQKLNYIPSDINIIIEKIVKNPIQFYERIAGELSEEEFLFIRSLIDNKNCGNCDNRLCRVPSIEKPIDNCISWSNPMLIGKIKLLRK